MNDQNRSGIPLVFKLAGAVLSGLELLLGSIEVVFYVALAVGGFVLLAHF